MSPRYIQSILVLCLLMTTTFAFAPMTQRHASLSKSLLHAGKGFGSSSPPPPKKKEQSFNEESNRSVENPTKSGPTKNEGQKALAEMRRERAEQRNAELRQYQEIKSVDEFISSTPDAAVIPEKVAMRMGKRMLPFVGIPLFGGMGAFVGFWYLATYRDMEFQPALVAFTTIGILAVGLLGITYSVMSASWDPDREESGFLGIQEFQRNVDSLRGGLTRSRENALIRERMGEMSQAEIQAALSDLDKKREEREQWSE